MCVCLFSFFLLRQDIERVVDYSLRDGELGGPPRLAEQGPTSRGWSHHTQPGNGAGGATQSPDCWHVCDDREGLKSIHGAGAGSTGPISKHRWGCNRVRNQPSCSVAGAETGSPALSRGGVPGQRLWLWVGVPGDAHQDHDGL